MSYDDWKLMTPEEWSARWRGPRPRRHEDDGPPERPCFYCGEPTTYDDDGHSECDDCREEGIRLRAAESPVAFDDHDLSSDMLECESCHKEKHVSQFASKYECTDCYTADVDPPAGDDDNGDDDDKTDVDPDATPIITGDDPDEMIPDELGGES